MSTKRRPARLAWRPMNTKRESARLAWRQRVDFAARRYAKYEAERRAYMATKPNMRGYVLQGIYEDLDFAFFALRDALAAPKPWVSGGQRPQPVRHSRASRESASWCKRCSRFNYSTQPF